MGRQGLTPASGIVDTDPIEGAERGGFPGEIPRPRPGARGGARYGPTAPSGPESPPEPSISPMEPAHGFESDALLALARPLLALLTSIASSSRHPDPAGLRDALATEVSRFERQAQAAGLRRESIMGGKYVLCAALDEAAATTPWGGGGTWAADTLLIRFFNESWGGEKVFQLLARISERPGENRDLIELIYVCLSLGFEGRYRVEPNGRLQLAQLRERVHALLARERGAVPAALSPDATAAVVRRRRWLGAAPAWVLGVLVAAGMLLAFSGYSIALAKRSDPIFARILALKTGREPVAAQPVVSSAVPVVPRARLAPYLSEDMAAGRIRLQEDGARSLVTIAGDGFFKPGSASATPAGLAILDRLGKALAAVEGAILIRGHTDSQPIRTARFPSNWHLSKARAEFVMRHLAAVVPASRMSVEGRADSEPLATNETVAGRAQNRRVELIVFGAGDSR